MPFVLRLIFCSRPMGANFLVVGHYPARKKAEVLLHLSCRNGRQQDPVPCSSLRALIA
jgi:hypothetical protein